LALRWRERTLNKDNLLEMLEDEREKFLDTIDGLTEEQLQIPGVIGEWSTKDIIAHLCFWEAELVKLLWQVRQGQKPTSAQLLRVPVDALNEKWFQETHSRPLERVLSDYSAVRKQTIRRLDGFSDRELNDPKRYGWLNNQPLWEWIAEDSFQHESEHRSQIREWRSKQGI
jgi:hypothetical protein